jgi:hypothetical protein
MNTKLLRNNMLILLGYAVVAQLLALSENSGGGMFVAIVMMVALVIHVVVLVLGCLIQLASGRRKEAGQWILCALLVGVIGFGTCFGGAALADLWSGPANFH